MILFLLLIISLLVLSSVRFSVFDLLQPVAEKSHLFCLEHLPKKAIFIAELNALVCAENFPLLQDSHFYISSGLIHLFVVSGAHLILLERLFSALPEASKPSSGLILGLLGLYALACGLNPPVARSWLLFAVVAALRRVHTYWPAHFRVLITGLLTLLFHYKWVTSLSLQLSWIAALTMTVSFKERSAGSALQRQSLFYFLMFPTVVFFQIPAFSTILLNLALAPVLELILFPLALATWFCGFLYPLFDFLIGSFRQVLIKTEMDFRFQLTDLPAWLILFNWGLIFSLHLFLHLLNVRRQRSQ